MTDDKSWMTICAEMYGQMERKPIAHWPSAPPVKTSNQSKSPPWELSLKLEMISLSTVQSTPGVGIWDTKRHTNTSPSVINIFLRSSGMRNAFEKPFAIDMLLFSPLETFQ